MSQQIAAAWQNWALACRRFGSRSVEAFKAFKVCERLEWLVKGDYPE